jgi:dynein heavy chain, axonemal
MKLRAERKAAAHRLVYAHDIQHADARAASLTLSDGASTAHVHEFSAYLQVAGLMPKDELDAIVNDMRPIMKGVIQRGELPPQPDTYENLYSFYLNRVRDNLHLVLCFSPVGAKFSRRAMQFPGLINGCTIDWFLPWPEEALTSVSGKFIQSFDMACDKAVKDSLKLVMGHVHVFVTAACHEYFEKFRRHAYVTPKSFLSFIQFYMNLYKVKWEGVAHLAQARASSFCSWILPRARFAPDIC